MRRNKVHENNKKREKEKRERKKEKERERKRERDSVKTWEIRSFLKTQL